MDILGHSLGTGVLAAGQALVFWALLGGLHGTLLLIFLQVLVEEWEETRQEIAWTFITGKPVLAPVRKVRSLVKWAALVAWAVLLVVLTALWLQAAYLDWSQPGRFIRPWVA